MLNPCAGNRSRPRDVRPLASRCKVLDRPKAIRVIGTALLTLFLLAACGVLGGTTSSDEDALALELESGRTIEELSSDSVLSIVVLVAASECLSCSNDMNRWVETARDHHGYATLVLSSQPAAEVRDALIRMRLPFEVVHQHDEQRARDLAPTVLVLEPGQSPMIETNVVQSRRAFLVDSVQGNLRERRTHSPDPVYAPSARR